MGNGRSRLKGSATESLRDLRRARRQRFVEQIDVMELLYRVYVGAIFGAIGLGVIAGAVHEAPATPDAVEWLRLHGPSLLGLGVAVLALAGLRSGARGGPLAIEAAEVQYVLLAPVNRGAALRPAAWRQLRVGALAGAIFGAVLGNFVFRRLPGSPVEWIGGLALFGALVPIAVLGAALVASGRRLRPTAATGIGALLVAWSGADLALGWTSSPGTMLGEVATLPLQHGAGVILAAAGVALVSVLLALGLLGVGGILLEAAQRRASLVAELRFSAAVQDVRAVVLLRRQLSSERPRRRPWLKLPAGRAEFPVWRRDWQSFLRWPASRIGRALLIGAVAGAMGAGAWRGATLAFFLPGLLLFVVALDFVEPLAQEADHPTRRQLLPVDSGSLAARHLVAPSVAIAVVILVASLGAVAAGGSASIALGVGAVSCLPLSLVLAGCAAFSATTDPYAYMFTPEIGYAVTGMPPLIASAIVAAPLLAAREVEREGASAVTAAAGSTITIGVIGLIALYALSRRFSKRDAVSA
jgi:hypothetical protein